MKMPSSTLALLLSLAGMGPVVAADLPARVASVPVYAAPVYNWTGLYIGVNGGYGWGQQDPFNLLSNRFDRSSFDIDGGMFGGTLGAQIQQGYVVLGIEADLDWANIKGNATRTPALLGLPVGVTLNTATEIKALGTARARVGVAMNNWLLYGTGGVAFTNSSANGTSVAGVPCGTLGVIPNCSSSQWRGGLAAGLGLEWGFSQNWTAKAEYLYVATTASGASTDHLNIVRGGINYRFSGN